MKKLLLLTIFITTGFTAFADPVEHPQVLNCKAQVPESACATGAMMAYLNFTANKISIHDGDVICEPFHHSGSDEDFELPFDIQIAQFPFINDLKVNFQTIYGKSDLIYDRAKKVAELTLERGGSKPGKYNLTCEEDTH